MVDHVPELAGQFCGAVAAVGIGVDLRHGDSSELPVVIGTASCLPDRSYVVPPGDYETVAELSVALLGGESRPAGRQALVCVGPTITATA